MENNNKIVQIIVNSTVAFRNNIINGKSCFTACKKGDVVRFVILTSGSERKRKITECDIATDPAGITTPLFHVRPVGVLLVTGTRYFMFSFHANQSIIRTL